MSESASRRYIFWCAAVDFVRITQAFKLYSILHLVTASMYARQDVRVDWRFFFKYSVDRAFVHNLVNENNLKQNLFLVYFVNFIYNLYMFRTSPIPSSGGTTVFIRHWLSGMQDRMHSILHTRQPYGITSTKFRINKVAPPDDGPGEVRNM